MNPTNFEKRMNRKLLWATLREKAWLLALIVALYAYAILYPL